MYGARGRIGVIDLSTCLTLTPEFYAAAPEGVAILFSRLRLPGGEVSVEALDAMLATDRILDCAEELADAEVQVITFGCTTASLLHGRGWDAALIERLGRRVQAPCTTTATAVLEALRSLGARSIAVGTPYVEELNRRERVFFEDAGLDVRGVVGLGIDRDTDIARLDEASVMELARRAARRGGDALFLSCTNLPTLRVIDALESELRRPVVTSNAATIWQALRMVGALPARPGFGTLLSNAS